MTARNYDVKLKVTDASQFSVTNVIVGNATSAVGYIAGVDVTNNILKVKLANILQEFSSTEKIHSNIILTSGTANGSLNTSSLPFQANIVVNSSTIAIDTISAITPSGFIAEKNAFEQNPVVRLYSLYYPGEWYPPNEYGNPSGPGEGRSWPNNFPMRFAEIVGDLAQDISYNVVYNGTSYVPFPVNLSGLEQGTDGKINELSITLFNVDNQISRLVEDPYLAGNNTSNSVIALVNGEYVHGIDPRTVNASPGSYAIGSTAYTALLKARNDGLDYDQTVVDSIYGMSNASFNKEQTAAVNGTWQAQKTDTRDLLGGIVEVKTTFANFLDYWPEYSPVVSTAANTIIVRNSTPYRVGDIVKHPDSTYSNATIVSIDSSSNITINHSISRYKWVGGVDVGPQDMFWGTGGTNLYFIGNNNKKVYRYTATKPFNISSLSALPVDKVSVANVTSTVTSAVLSTTGSNLYVADQTLSSIKQYSLSTPWVLSSATYSKELSLSGLLSGVTGIAFDTAGANLYVVGSSANVVSYNLASSWDLATASYKSNLSVTAQDTQMQAITFFNASNMYLTGATNDKVYRYTLSTGWDISSGTYHSDVYLGNYDTIITGISWRPNGNTFHFIGTTTDSIYQLPVGTAGNLTTFGTYVNPGDPLYISNIDADTESFMEDKYKIDQLETLTEYVATFGLVSWLQYFKAVTPRRKYYKNTCQWLYKGAECQYPGPSDIAGANAIPGTNQTAPPYAIAANNMIMPTTEGDVCAKSLTACSMRNNTLHFGGFPGVGRTVPRA